MAKQWMVIDGRIARRGKRRLIYPDPMSEKFLEAQCGVLNIMLLNQSEPKDFSPEDRLRARGMGIRLGCECKGLITTVTNESLESLPNVG